MYFKNTFEDRQGSNSFCASEMLKLISIKGRLKIATDNTVNKLTSHMIKISKIKKDFEAAHFSLVLLSVGVRKVFKFYSSRLFPLATQNIPAGNIFMMIWVGY